MPIETRYPATGDVLATFDEMDEAVVDARLTAASEAVYALRSTSPEQRADWLSRAADLLDQDNEQVAKLMTTEMGKTVNAARAEATKCARALRYFAEHGPGYLEAIQADAAAMGALNAESRFEPLGVVLAIMPWNFPLWQAMRFAAPALMAGNVGVLKHASNVPQTALWLERLFLNAGFPTGAFQTLLIGAGRVEALLRDPRIAAATLTGSEAAGRAVGRVAGEELKKTVLELGGSDPFVVMTSADLPRAARTAAIARTMNNGQSCIAAKRFIAAEDIADEFEQLFVKELAALTVGDPMLETTDVGPLATEQGRRDVEDLVDDAVRMGARLLLGGTRPEGAGWFYPPTLLTGIDPTMRIHREEAFGPVATLYRVQDIDAAIALANDTPFGLGATIWTSDDLERERFISGVAAGMVFVNGMTTSHLELPFGGIKASGYGRELTALGMREFMNIKSVWVGAP
jgi:succinate-semialdehyde dehydrogenase/glutarate-semialdehyde dehydrogenase